MTDSKEMTYEEIVKANEGVYAKITKCMATIEELKGNILPVPNAPLADLVGSNSNALAQRKAQFEKKVNEKKAIQAALIIAENNKAKPAKPKAVK